MASEASLNSILDNGTPMSFPRRKTTFRIQRDCPAILFTNSYPYFFATPHAVNDCKDEAATKTTTATGLGHCEAGDEDVRFAFLVFERGILNISYWLGGPLQSQTRVVSCSTRVLFAVSVSNPRVGGKLGDVTLQSRIYFLNEIRLHRHDERGVFRREGRRNGETRFTGQAQEFEDESKRAVRRVIPDLKPIPSFFGTLDQGTKGLFQRRRNGSLLGHESASCRR